MKCAVIARYRTEYPVRLMCRVLAVSPSAYYASRKPRQATTRAIANDGLLVHVRLIYRRSHGTYGAPRIHQDLRAQDIHVSRKRVARLMQQDALVARPQRARRRTTNSAHAYPVAPNLLERAFDVNGMRVNQVWVSDLTYVPTRAGWLYLAVVLDLASRRVVGWATSASLEVDLVVRAVRRAVATRRPETGLIHHSDRGVQYACGEYQAVLATHGMVASMSRKGDCWDNAVAESFFATVEMELLARYTWPTHAEAEQAICRYIEFWYNRTRRHSTLGYRSPAAYEREILQGSLSHDRLNATQ